MNHGVIFQGNFVSKCGLEGGDMVLFLHFNLLSTTSKYACFCNYINFYFSSETLRLFSGRQKKLLHCFMLAIRRTI